MRSKMRRKNSKGSDVLEVPRTVGPAKKGARRGGKADSARPAKARTAAQAAPQASPGIALAVRSAGPLAHGTRAQALEIIFATAIRDGEGFRTGALGNPRFGKTFHLQDVIDQALAQGISRRVFIHDVKKPEPQYQGATAASPEAWASEIEHYQTEPIVVFHAAPPVPRPSVQAVCTVAQAVAAEGEPCLLVVDEMFKATTGGRAWLKGPEGEPALIAEFLREGSSCRISTAWTTQIPQSLPTEALVLTETCALFHLEGLSASYAAEAYRLDPDAVAALSTLGRGEFILFDSNHAWNRTIYGPK